MQPTEAEFNMHSSRFILTSYSVVETYGITQENYLIKLAKYHEPGPDLHPHPHTHTRTTSIINTS